MSFILLNYDRIIPGNSFQHYFPISIFPTWPYKVSEFKRENREEKNFCSSWDNFFPLPNLENFKEK